MADTGKLDEMKGRVQKGVGEVTNDPALKHKGTVEKISGNIKQSVEHAKDSIKHGIDHAKEKLENVIDRNKKA